MDERQDHGYICKTCEQYQESRNPSAKRRRMEEGKRNDSVLPEEVNKELEERYERYRAVLQNLTLMSDVFMRNVLKKKECTEHILRTVLGEEVQVVDQTIQKDYKNLQGRSAVLDCVAEGDQNRRMNIEIQQEKEGASPKRARYHSGLIDMNTLDPRQDFDELPENYVIFITRTDVIGEKKQIYHIDRRIQETGKPFGDDTFIIYVNAGMQDDTEIGRLVHDLHCKKAEDMYSEVLAKRVLELKETVEGKNDMCREMDEIYNWGIEDEKKNTEKERKRAEQAEKKVEEAEKKVERAENRAEQAAKLTAFLLENGRVEDCLRAVKDENYQMQLMKELNIA